MCSEYFTYMIFQSTKAACNDEYVTPDINNSTCMDDIGLVAEVRGLAHLVVSKQIYFILIVCYWWELLTEFSFTSFYFNFFLLFYLSLCYVTKCVTEFVVHNTSKWCTHFGTQVYLCNPKTKNHELGKKIFWRHTGWDHSITN